MDEEWEEDLKEVWLPQYDYILEEIERLFLTEQRKVTEGQNAKKQRAIRKNLQLTRIFLPVRDFKFLEEYRDFKRLHNLGGIPVQMVEEEKIRVDVEVVDPRKRKRKAVIYVKPAG